MTRQITKDDEPRDRLIKLIPAEIVTAYLALQSLLIDLGENVVYGVIVFLFIMTFFYLRRFGGVTDWIQLTFSAVSFLIWVFSIAPEEILKSWYNPKLATVVLFCWTLLIPFVYKPGAADETAKGSQ